MEPINIKENVTNNIIVAELDNINWMAYNTAFQDLLKEFVSILDIPSITYESLFNYLASLVVSQMTILPAMRHTRIYVGIQDNIPIGFTMMYKCPAMMPHISRCDVPYIYSKDPKLTFKFMAKVISFMKRWHLKYLGVTVTNERIEKVYMRVLKKPKKVGTELIARGIKDVWTFGESKQKAA